MKRLNRVKKALDGTKFQFRESNDGVETVCSWGNRITVHEPDVARFGRVQLGMPYVRFDVRPGTAERIARFYREVVDAPAEVKKNGAGPEAKVQVGENQYFYFRETDAPQPDYDGHHVQIYLSNFSRPYRKLLDLGLITIEDNDYQYRFKDVIDLDTQGSAVHGRARDAQRHQSDVWPAADQPQSGSHQHGLQAGTRQHVLGAAVIVIPAPVQRVRPSAGPMTSSGRSAESIHPVVRAMARIFVNLSDGVIWGPRLQRARNNA